MNMPDNAMSVQKYLHECAYYEDINKTEAVCHGYFYLCDSTLIYPIIFTHYKHDILKSPLRQPSARPYRNTIFIYLKGDMTFVTEKRTYHMNYGDVFLVRANESFCGRSTADTFIDFYEIAIPEMMYEKVRDKDFFGNLFYNREEGTYNHISLNDTQKSKLFEKLEKIEKHINSAKSHDFVAAYSYFIQFMYILNKNAGETPDNYSMQTSAPCVLKAMKYIQTEFVSIKSVEEVASHCFVSSQYLGEQFKKSLNTTINSFLKNTRISNSKYLLKSGHTVSDACYKSGFNSYSYFIQEFRKSTGRTPLKYKQAPIDDE